MKTLRLVLGLSMAGTLLAAVLAPDPADLLVSPTQRGATASAGASEASTGSASATTKPVWVDVLAIRPRGLADDVRGSSVFATNKRPQPAPSAMAAPEAPARLVVEAPPQLPPPPFRVLGRYVEDGEETVFLQYAEQNLAARVGDVLSDQYKVESISAGTITLTHLQSNQRQTLAIGDTQ